MNQENKPMQYIFHQYASGYDIECRDKDHLIDTIRELTCGQCLNGGYPYVMDDTYVQGLDAEYNGKIYECRDLELLMSSDCACEFGYTDLLNPED